MSGEVGGPPDSGPSLYPARVPTRKRTPDLSGLIHDLRELVRLRSKRWKLPTEPLPALDAILGIEPGAPGRGAAINELIRRAVNRLDSADVSSALNLLFDNSGRSLTVVRSAAADAVHVSADYFRKTVEPELLHRLADQILTIFESTATSNAAPSRTARKAAKRQRGATARGLARLTHPVVYLNQSEADRAVERYVLETRPTQAWLIEYSTFTVAPLIADLRSVNATVNVLMCHPEAAPPGWQRDRVRQGIRYLIETLFEDYERWVVHLYQVPPSLRGRLMLRGRPHQGIAVAGWYTHRVDTADDQASDAIWGHDNPIVIAETTTPQGRILAQFLQSAYFELLAHPNTVPISGLAGSARPPWPKLPVLDEDDS